MTLTTLIAINAALDSLAVAAVFAIVRFTHRLDHGVATRGPVPRPSRRASLRAALDT